MFECRLLAYEIHLSSVSQPFFGSRHPCLVLQKFGGKPGWFIRYKIKKLQLLAAPLVPVRVLWQLGWESLYVLEYA